MKRYTIPKYLRKRKLEIIRQKIITRKYGYQFYRKSVCKMLPSQARKFYLKKLLTKYFTKWFLYWYETTIGWKLYLKADIHYNLSIRQKCFKAWLSFHLNTKNTLIKERMAVIFWEKNRARFKKRVVFEKWKLLVKLKKAERTEMVKAWGFFRLKNYPGFIRSYFYRWLAFIKFTKKRKHRLYWASKIYERNLMRNCFRRIIAYKRIKEIENDVIKLYQLKLLKFSFKSWKNYLKQQLTVKQNIVIAGLHYSFKLKQQCFRLFYETMLESRRIKQAMKQKNHDLVKRVFAKWKVYLEGKKSEHRKCMIADDFSGNKLKKQALMMLGNYALYRRKKRVEAELRVKRVVDYIGCKKTKRVFVGWRDLSLRKQANKMNKLKAWRANRKRILYRFFSLWIIFKNYKKNRKQHYFNAIQFHKTVLTKNCFQRFQLLLTRKKQFNDNIERAKLFYKTNLAEEGVKLIVLAGIIRKEVALKKRIEDVFNEAYIAQKYANIWKRKSIFKISMEKSMVAERELIMESDGGAEWFQICFLAPRMKR